MNNLSTYIIEKLRINKDIKVSEKTDYFQIDISDEIDMPDWAYDYRKLKNGSKNRLWYAVYCLLYKEGPMKSSEIIGRLKPGSRGYEGRFMSELRNHQVIRAGTGKERGLQFPVEPKYWSDFTNNSFIC